MLKDCLLLFQTDIIVNSVGMHSDLKVGRVSNAILGKGGPSLEKEFQNNLKKHLSLSEEQLVWTKGHNLASKTVLHVVWPYLPYPIGDKHKVMFNSIGFSLLYGKQVKLVLKSFYFFGRYSKLQWRSVCLSFHLLQFLSLH